MLFTKSAVYLECELFWKQNEHFRSIPTLSKNYAVTYMRAIQEESVSKTIPFRCANVFLSTNLHLESHSLDKWDGKFVFFFKAAHAGSCITVR